VACNVQQISGQARACFIMMPPCTLTIVLQTSHTGDDTISWHHLLLHVEICAAVLDQLIVLAE
jgi:hypothetical protein